MALLRRPKHSGSATLAYSRSRLNLFLSETYVGERNDVNPVYVYGASTILRNDAFNKVDLGVNWQMNPHVTFIARIDNLLNQQYEEILGYPAYQLNFSAGLKIRLGGKVNPVFAEAKERSGMQEKHGFSSPLPTILVSSGASAIGPMGQLVEELLSLHNPAQLAVICGRNRRLQQALEQVGASPSRPSRQA